MQKKTIAFILANLFGIFVCVQSAWASQNKPTLLLFTTPVVENFKLTSQSSDEMETSLSPIAQKMAKQMELFKASNCQDSESDEGCEAIRKELSTTYKTLLDTMENKFEKMEPTLNNSLKSLQKQIYSELGLKMTPRDLQKTLEGRKDQTLKKKVTRNGRLSKRFRKYYELVALGNRNGANGSLATVASEIYLDISEVSELVGVIREEISRSRLMIDLDPDADLVSDKMFATIGSVKSIIFGEETDYQHIPGPPPGSTPKTFISPLEL